MEKWDINVESAPFNGCSKYHELPPMSDERNKIDFFDRMAPPR